MIVINSKKPEKLIFQLGILTFKYVVISGDGSACSPDGSAQTKFRPFHEHAGRCQGHDTQLCVFTSEIFVVVLG